MIKPGPLSPRDADTLNKALEQLSRLSNPRSYGGGISVTRRGGTMTLDTRVVPRIVAKITGHHASHSDDTYAYESCKYSFVEWRAGPDDCEGSEINGGTVGFTDWMPAVEISGRDDIEEGTIVEMWLSPDGQHWRFTPGGLGGGPGLILDVVTCVSLIAGNDSPSL